MQAGRHVNDLFEDLQDGHNLISLLEVLSGQHLPREKGRLRFHMLQNIQVSPPTLNMCRFSKQKISISSLFQMCLNFLRYRKIKLVNIRAEDIVDGNPKLTLGLIWTIILHFQVKSLFICSIIAMMNPSVWHYFICERGRWERRWFDRVLLTLIY